MNFKNIVRGTEEDKSYFRGPNFSAGGSGRGYSGIYKGWYFRSLLELSFMVLVIEPLFLKWESPEDERFYILYKHPDGKIKKYFPDFIIDGIHIIEIKPKRDQKNNVVLAKVKAARKFAKENGMTYELIDTKYLLQSEIKQLYFDGELIFTTSTEKKFFRWCGKTFSEQFKVFTDEDLKEIFGDDGVFWTLERCKEDALKYKHRSDWQRAKPSGYPSASKRGWLEKCCAHMEYIGRENGYWTLERCKEEALKYDIVSKWQKKSLGSYKAAKQHGWLEECMKHMVPGRETPNGYWTFERCIEDALKYNQRSRWQDNSSGAYKAACSHDGWLEQCCAHMPEIQKPIGYWTLERCMEDALKYSTRSEWQKNSSGAYDKVVDKKWQEQCCGHMIETQKPKNYWTFELVKKDGQRFKKKKDWMNNAPDSYSAAYKNGWLDEICENMEQATPKNYWTLELCKEDALKYITKKEWRKNSVGAYQAAWKHKGWVQECCKHMVELKKLQNYWTLKLCMDDALKFKTTKEWRENSAAAYQAACKYKWVVECSKHFVPSENTRKYWTLELCQADAFLYKTKKEWDEKSSGGYRAAERYGWLSLCPTQNPKDRRNL